MQELADETNQIYQLLVPPSADILPGENRMVFGLFDNEGRFVADLDLTLHYGSSADSAPKEQVDVLFMDEGLDDKAFYSAMIDVDSPGEWPVLIVEQGTDEMQGAGSIITVKESSEVPQVGDKAPVVATPTTHDHLGVPDICTREPEGPMHDISLDEALANDKPTVVALATPAFCSSRTCGPVVEQVLGVHAEHADNANFIHIEVWEDVNEGIFLEAFEAWNLTSEPWVFVIDADGVIQARFEGPVTTSEISDALEALLEA